MRDLFSHQFANSPLSDCRYRSGSTVANNSACNRADGRDCHFVECQDNLEFMRNLDDGQMKLVVTSPPYNLGKTKERRTSVDEYLEWQERVIRECVRVLHPNGSICWQVGNYVHRGEIIPLDALFYPIFKKTRAQTPKSDCMALRSRYALLEAIVRPVRNHQLVDRRVQ